MNYAFAMSPALKRIYRGPRRTGARLTAPSEFACLIPRRICQRLSFGCRLRWRRKINATRTLTKGRSMPLNIYRPDGAAGRDRRFLFGDRWYRRKGWGYYFAQQGAAFWGRFSPYWSITFRILCRWYAAKLGYRAGTTADAPLAKAG